MESERESLEMQGVPLAVSDSQGLHRPAHPDRRRVAGARRRRGTTSATSWWSTSGPTPRPWPSLLPEGMEPHPDAGRCAAVFADWQSCSRGRRRADRPVALAVQGVLPRGQRAAGRRGGHHLPVHLGRPATSRWRAAGSRASRRSSARCGSRATSAWAAPPTPACAAGARFGGTCSAHGRRLAQATVTLEGPADEAGPQHNARRSSTSATSRAWPRAATTSRRSTSWCARSAATAAVSEVWEGDADAGAVRGARRGARPARAGRIGRGYRFTFAYTVDDLETVRELGS